MQFQCSLYALKTISIDSHEFLKLTGKGLPPEIVRHKEKRYGRATGYDLGLTMMMLMMTMEEEPSNNFLA